MFPDKSWNTIVAFWYFLELFIIGREAFFIEDFVKMFIYLIEKSQKADDSILRWARIQDFHRFFVYRIKGECVFFLTFGSIYSELSSAEVSFPSGSCSRSAPTQSLVEISASTNSLALPYFLAEYSCKSGTIFLFW